MIKVKTFYAYADSFDKKVNAWLEVNPGIDIVDWSFKKDWTPGDIIGNKKLQFYLFIEYKELRNDK